MRTTVTSQWLKTPPPYVCHVISTGEELASARGGEATTAAAVGAAAAPTAPTTDAAGAEGERGDDDAARATARADIACVAPFSVVPPYIRCGVWRDGPHFGRARA